MGKGRSQNGTDTTGSWGANDFGGTLINESISTSAGSQHGQLLRPSQIRALIRQTGKKAAERNTTYEILRTFDEDMVHAHTRTKLHVNNGFKQA